MPLTLRRLLNHLPLSHGSSEALYVKDTWHKPTIYDQWRSQPPFRPMTTQNYRFGRALRWQRWRRALLWSGAVVVAAWLVVESVRGLQLF